MTKKELRKLYKQKRKTLSNDKVFTLSKAIFHRFIEKFDVKNGQHIHLFLTIKELKEVETSFFIDYFFDKKVRLYVPKIVNDKLISVEIDKNSIYKKNEWNITEPISNEESKLVKYDYVITPLLYSDLSGNRVGYGKGYYDAFFHQLDKDILKIGINFFEPNESIDDVRADDVSLDYLVTPIKVLSFKGLGK